MYLKLEFLHLKWTEWYCGFCFSFRRDINYINLSDRLASGPDFVRSAYLWLLKNFWRHLLSAVRLFLLTFYSLKGSLENLSEYIMMTKFEGKNFSSRRQLPRLRCLYLVKKQQQRKENQWKCMSSQVWNWASLSPSYLSRKYRMQSTGRHRTSGEQKPLTFHFWTTFLQKGFILPWQI